MRILIIDVNYVYISAIIICHDNIYFFRKNINLIKVKEEINKIILILMIKKKINFNKIDCLLVSFTYIKFFYRKIMLSFLNMIYLLYKIPILIISHLNIIISKYINSLFVYLYYKNNFLVKYIFNYKINIPIILIKSYLLNISYTKSYIIYNIGKIFDTEIIDAKDTLNYIYIIQFIFNIGYISDNKIKLIFYKNYLLL